MTIEESKMMWKLEVENNKPLYSSFSKEMKRLYNKVDELINEKVEHTGGDREVLVDNIELSDETQLRESERANETC